MNTWSQEEKELLLAALRKYGINNLEALANEIPYKSVSDIRNVITKYENIATRSLADCVSSENAPIDKWIDVVKQLSSLKNNHNIISRVLKYIALYEKRVDSKVDLKDCYMVLSELTSGRAAKEMNPETTLYFNDCLSTMAMLVKCENTHDEEMFLDNLKVDKSASTKTYGRKVTNALINDPDMNTLKVPANLLK